MSSGKIVLYQLLITICLLLTLEAGARLATSVYYEAKTQKQWFVFSADLGWDRRPNFNGSDICNAHRVFGPNGFVSVDEAQLQKHGSTHPRVIFVGDSNTYGYCLATESTFVEVADRLLPNYDLINLGVPGYTSYQGYKELQKYGELIKPEKIFISFNFNDRRNVAGEDIDSDATFQKTTSSTRLLEYSHLFRVIRALGTKSGFIRSSIEESVVSVDRLKPRVDPQSYKTNLINMVEWSRKHGATPYFILLGDNPNRTVLLRKGISEYDQNDDEAAIRDLTRFLTSSRTLFGPIARKYLSMAYERLGLKDQAQHALLAKPVYLLHGGDVVLEDSVYNKIMRDVAREYTVQLVDAKSELDKRPWVYFDMCHFDMEGHEIVGKMISELLNNDSEAKTTAKNKSGRY